MFKVNETDKKICEMVIGKIKCMEKFNNEKIDIIADNEFAKVYLSYENIKDVLDGKKSPSITIRCYKLPTMGSISLNLNNPESGYEHNIDIYKNEDLELFKDFIDAMMHLGNLKIDYTTEAAKVIIEDVFNNL